jgi:hypothetical protein
MEIRLNTKKGLIVSIIGFIFLSSLFSLSIDFKKRSTFMNDNLLDMFGSKKIKLSQGNIADNFLDLIGLKIVFIDKYFISNNNFTTLKFLIPRLSNNRTSPNILLNTYESFINNQYKVKTNTDLSFSVNSPSILFSVPNLSLKLNSANLNLELPEGFNIISNFNLTLHLNKNFISLNNTAESLSSGSNPFNIFIYDNSSNLIYESSNFIDYDSLSFLSLSFNDTFPSSNLSLVINNNNFNLSLDNDLELNDNELILVVNNSINNKLYIWGDAYIHISTKSKKINKTGRLVLVES